MRTIMAAILMTIAGLAAAQPVPPFAAVQSDSTGAILFPTNVSLGVLDAPFDTNQYVRENGAWVELGAAQAPVDSVFGRTGAVTADGADYAEYYLSPGETVTNIPFELSHDGPFAEGLLGWYDTHGNLAYGLPGDIVADVNPLMLRVHNDWTNTIPAGTVLARSGQLGNARLDVRPASLTNRPVGVAVVDIPISGNQTGYATAGGLMDLDTRTLGEGCLYLGSGGQLVTNAPAPPVDVWRIGCVVISGEAGKILVNIAPVKTYTALDTQYLRSESDPVWTNYLATAFTGAVDAIAGAIAVTGAVTSINDIDGALTFAAGDGLTLETNLNTLTYSSTIDTGAFYLASNPAGYLTNYVETDPVWTAASGSYLTASAAASLYATGTPLYAESDPVWTNYQATAYTGAVQAIAAAVAATSGLVNVVSPVTVSTNVTGTWTINLTTNNPVAIYEQSGNITSVTFSVDSTNDVALGEVILLATTNAITWPTNGLTWSTGTAPTPSNGVYNILYFRAWRDDVHGVYIGDTP